MKQTTGWTSCSARTRWTRCWLVLGTALALVTGCGESSGGVDPKDVQLGDLPDDIDISGLDIDVGGTDAGGDSQVGTDVAGSDAGPGSDDATAGTDATPGSDDTAGGSDATPGSDDAAQGSDDAAQGSDDAAQGTDDAAAGSDAAAGTDDASAGTDDAAAGSDAAPGSDDAAGSDTTTTCDDNNACTTDAPDGNGGCVFTPIAVDDGDACTTDACDPVAGPSHVTLDVDDGNACTVDSCDPVAGPSHVTLDVDDGNPCTTDSCDPVAGPSYATASVDDGNPCTFDSCDPLTGVLHLPGVEDDGDACTADACDPATGVTHTAIDPDDGNPCTTDSCDPANGVQNVPNNGDDNNVCTLDTCDPLTGPANFELLVEDDKDACTKDICDPVAGVQHLPIDPDDGDACTIDSCDSKTGVKHTPIATDDNSACTTDACDPKTGVSHTPVDPDDGNVCTIDACDPQTGVSHTPVATDDDNACTVDACDPATGVTHTAVDPDDGNVCTIDACDPQTGVSHTPVATDDSNACTIDACDPATGVTHTAVDPDDNNVCTTDACDPATGVTHTAISVDDNNPCTVDSCDPALGPQYQPLDPSDGNACTADACDPATGVTHTAIDPDDGNICTIDSCDPAVGPQHDPVPVDDGDACTVDACDPASGVTHTALDPSDAFACTVDTCESATGPVHTGQSWLCPAGQVCDAGAGCVAAKPSQQEGPLVVTELQLLGSAKRLEVHNPSAKPVNLRDVWLVNALGEAAAIRAPGDVTATSTVDAVLEPGGYVVVGAQDDLEAQLIWVSATPWSLQTPKGGVALLATTGTLMDAVSWQLHSGNPDVSVAASDFAAWTGATSQLAPAQTTPQGNDDPLAWCVTFWADPSQPKKRVFHTWGQPSGSCTDLVINEVLADPNGLDDGKAYIELAGPGGAMLAGVSLFDVEGSTSGGGTLNSLGQLKLPQGWRVPVDGILLVADGQGTTKTTLVGGFSPADVLFDNVDPENNSRDAILLVRDGALLDAVGYDAGGNDLQVQFGTAPGIAGFLLVEGLAALAPTTRAGSFIVQHSLSRVPGAEDTDNNAADFRVDPTPTPGAPNDLVAPKISLITPGSASTSLSTSSVQVKVLGNDFGNVSSLKIGSVESDSCTMTSASEMTCLMPKTPSAGVWDVYYVSPADMQLPPIKAAQQFVWHSPVNGSGAGAGELDFCQIVTATATAGVGQPSSLINVRVRQSGVTNTTTGGSPLVLVELGYGTSATDPRSNTSWITWLPMQFQEDEGNPDLYQGKLTVPAAGTFAYAARFSLDGGVLWTYCDKDGAGADGAQTFSVPQLGSITVSP